MLQALETKDSEEVGRVRREANASVRIVDNNQALAIVRLLHLHWVLLQSLTAETLFLQRLLPQVDELAVLLRAHKRIAEVDHRLCVHIAPVLTERPRLKS